MEVVAAAAPHPPPNARPVLIVSRPRAKPPVKKITPAQRARTLKGQLADSEEKVKSATQEAAKERTKIKRLQGKPIEIADLESFSKDELADILQETGGAVRKRDTWNDLADKVCKPNPPIAQQPRPPKKVRPAADEDDEPQLIRREKSASGRTLRPPTRRADEHALPALTP